MRALLLAGLLLTIALAGCTGSGSNLQPYLMLAHETPEGCERLPYNGDEGKDLQEGYNWTGNPGSVDSRVFEEGGIAPVANLATLYECGDSGIASIALRFATPEDASAWVGDDIGCDLDEGYEGEAGIMNGAIVAFVEGSEDIPDMGDSLRAWLQRVAGQTGAQNPCATPEA